MAQGGSCPDDTFPLFFPSASAALLTDGTCSSTRTATVASWGWRRTFFCLAIYFRSMPTLKVHLYFLCNSALGWRLLLSYIVNSLLNSTCSSDKLFKINTFEWYFITVWVLAFFPEGYSYIPKQFSPSLLSLHSQPETPTVNLMQTSRYSLEKRFWDQRSFLLLPGFKAVNTQFQTWITKAGNEEKRVSPVQGCWVAMRVLVFTAPSRLPATPSSSSKTIQLLYSWLLQTMSGGEEIAQALEQLQDLSLTEPAAGLGTPACLCAAPQPFTYFGYFGHAGSPRQLDSSCGCSVGW